MATQLHESGYYRASFFRAISLMRGARVHQHYQDGNDVPYYRAALFFPFLSLFVGGVLASSGMIGVFMLRNNFFASGLVVVALVIFFRGFFNREAFAPNWFDISILLLFLTIADTAIAQQSFLPLVLAAFTGGLSITFACGLGSDVPLTLPEHRLCGKYANEDYFFLLFTLLALGIASLFVLGNSWLYGILVSLVVAALTPHFLSRLNGGVTLSVLSRSFLLATTISYALFLM